MYIFAMQINGFAFILLELYINCLHYMCGIVSIFNISRPTSEIRPKALEMSRKLRHRGPDWSGIYQGKRAILCHERLAIVDPESGRQPLFTGQSSNFGRQR